jgi:hypothetical protein
MWIHCYLPDDQRIRVWFWAEEKIILFILFTRVLWPPSLLPNKYQVFSSQGVDSPRLEVDHPPPFNAEVKTASNYTSMPLYAFMAWGLINHNNTFTSLGGTWHIRMYTSTQECICSTGSYDIRKKTVLLLEAGYIANFHTLKFPYRGIVSEKSEKWYWCTSDIMWDDKQFLASGRQLTDREKVFHSRCHDEHYWGFFKERIQMPHLTSAMSPSCG